MCLAKKTYIPRIALKDIVVYKRIEIINNKLRTPFTKDVIEIGKVYKGEFRKYTSNEYVSDSPTFIKSLFSESIDTGYIHSLKSIEDTFNIPGILVKCIIPKGTLYFIGEDNEFASRKLKYIEII